MKAMVFAAGIGSRLKEITKDTPKCLVEVGGKPMLEHVLERLKTLGVSEVAINLHHHPEQIRGFIESRHGFGLKVHFSHEPTLLDTGGGLKKLRGFFEKEAAFLIHNSDVYCTADLGELLSQHRRKGAIATTAVMKRPSSRGLFLNSQGELVGWTKETMGADLHSGALFAFSGISVCSGEIFSYMPPTEIFSLIEPYLAAARATHRVFGFEIAADSWIDIGTPERLTELRRKLTS